MAARKRRTELNDRWREKIRASMLVNRLMEHATSDEEIMSQSQINAARILLAKVAPDLKQTELTGEQGGPIQHKVTVTFR